MINTINHRRSNNNIYLIIRGKISIRIPESKHNISWIQVVSATQLF